MVFFTWMAWWSWYFGTKPAYRSWNHFVTVLVEQLERESRQQDHSSFNCVTMNTSDVVMRVNVPTELHSIQNLVEELLLLLGGKVALVNQSLQELKSHPAVVTTCRHHLDELQTITTSKLSSIRQRSQDLEETWNDQEQKRRPWTRSFSLHHESRA